MNRRSVVLMAILAACAAPLGGATPFEAAAADGATSTASNASAASGLSAAEVQRRILDAGYTNVRDVEFDDGRWTADATAAGGARVDLKLDRDGNVVVDPDDD